MKTSITMTFSEDDHEGDLKMVCHARDLYMSLLEISEYLRSQEKYNDNLGEDGLKAIEGVREHFFDILGNNGISLAMFE